MPKIQNAHKQDENDIKAGKYEINLAQLCIGSTSRKRSFDAIEIETYNGGRLRVSPNVDHGLPTPWGEKLLVALMCHAMDQGNPERLFFVPAEIGRIMKVDVKDGRFYRRFRREMASLASLFLTSKKAWFDKKRGKVVTLVTEEGFHVINKYQLTCAVEDKNERLKLERAGIHGWLEWGDFVKRNIEEGYLMRFNRNIYFEAPPIAAKAYLNSTVFLWKNGKYVFDLVDFANRINLGGWRWPSEVKAQLTKKGVIKYLVKMKAWKNEPKFHKKNGHWKMEVEAGTEVYTKKGLIQEDRPIQEGFDKLIASVSFPDANNNGRGFDELPPGND